RYRHVGSDKLADTDLRQQGLAIKMAQEMTNLLGAKSSDGMQQPDREEVQAVPACAGKPLAGREKRTEGMHGEHCTTGFTLRWRSRLILWSAAIVAAMLFAPAAFASSRENNQQFRGPFLLDDGITFFVVNPTGKAFSAEFRWRDRWREHQPRPFLIRAFDPDDRLVVRHEFEGERVPTRNVPWENVTLEIPGGLPGVYQIIAYGFAPAELDIALTPQLSFGVMGHPEWLASRAGQIQEAYFHVPPMCARGRMYATSSLRMSMEQRCSTCAVRTRAGQSQ
ncbi:MAG TPA: hypothetical protein PK400_08320, partial [Phycisphaerales bacterium]|nr:hypothetical protein [Phycisphaerales bacterium]